MKCPKCKFYNICKGRLNENVENCVRFKSAEQTNEEWLRQCNTEQLAEFVVKAMILYDNSEMTVLEAIKNAMKNDVKLSNYFMESLLEWLKQPSTKE